ncbi:DNRLRE domain-containing protein [Streptomyces sp. MNP-20]|uniref:DNRLRE domain-containing protein n=1 Tax=Streptomyces sp. MNP-20 TaxID=2721165 RepID=UPI0015577432|nr:DNRLRE domain-containing protein [Streptomyces sp. MNP-20]
MWSTCLALSGLLTFEAVASGATAVAATAESRSGKAGSDVPAGAPKAATDASGAVLKARLDGKRVEVVGSRTETRTVWANPDGTLTEDQSAGPVRFRAEDGSWRSVDINLAERADGSVAAKAHPLGLTLAGPAPERADTAATRRLRADEPVPAATPLVSLKSPEGQRVELGWRGALPAPRIDGTKATYPEALPHADLIVDATRTGFEQFLSLKSRAAVDEAGTLRMTLTAKGLTAKASPDGGVTFVDTGTGKAAGTLPAPVMWDARVDARSGEHPHRAPVEMAFAQRGDTVDLTLTPDAKFLADSETRFPVTVDPSVNLLSTFTTFVQEGWTTDQSTAKELKLGNNGSGQVARSFLRFDNRPVKNAEIKSATLKLWNHHSWSCQARAWEVWDTNAAGTATRWDSQPKWNRKWATSTQTKGFGSGCADGWVSADITSLAQAWATNPYNENILGLRAADEKDPHAWKRFNSRNAAGDVPVISVTYNRLPAAPSAVRLDPSASNTFNKRTYATSSTPTFSAKVSDPDGGTVKAQFEVTADPGPGDAGSYSWTGTSTGVASGAVAKVTLPADKKLGSFAYRVRARAHDGTAHGPWSEYAPFRVNTVKPVRPTVTCDGYPQDEWTDKNGELSCTFTTTSSDGRGFLYGLDDPNTPQQVNDPAGTGGKPQTVKLKAAKGRHTLHARTVDSAGLLSGTSTFQFGVGPKPAALLVPDVPTTLQEGATDTPAPLLSGVVTSADQARVSGEFALYDASGTALSGVVLPPSTDESGSRVATVVPEDTLVPGTTYQWAMRACGEAACSPWTPKRAFTAKAPKVGPAPDTRTVEIAALTDVTAPVGAEDCAGKDCAAVRDETLRVGTPGGVSWRSWLKADLAAVPAGARITDARLKLHRADCSADDDCAEPAATLKDLAGAWGPEESGQALAAAASDEAFDTEEGLPLPLGDLNIGPLVEGWLETGENHGLSLQLGDEKDAAPGVVYHSSRAADPAKRPKLVISYIPAAAPGVPQDVKAVPADGGLLATWNAPQDSGSAADALKYTVVLREGTDDVARQTVEDTRAVFSGLDNGAAHTVTVTAATEFGTSKPAASESAKPVAVASQDRYAQAVRDYFAARAALLKGTHATAEKAAAASPHGAMFRDLLAEQEPELTRTRAAHARRDRHFSEVKATFEDLLTGPGPDNTVVVRGRVTERTVLTHEDGTQEPEEGEAPGRFVFTDGVLRMEANDAAVEVTMPTDQAAVQAATVAPPAEDSLAEVAPPEDEALPTELDEDGMLRDDPAASGPPLAYAAPNHSGTASWAKRHVGVGWDHGNDCANFVSKALHHGGKMKIRKGPRRNLSSWYRGKIFWKRVDSFTWAAAANLRQHLKKYRGGREISRYDARPGDVIFAFYRKDRQWNHAGVVTGGKRGNLNITQHGSKNHTTLNQWLKPKKITAISVIRPGRRS